MLQFIDCSSINIQYDATGKASISFNVITDSYGAISAASYRSLYFGGVSFSGDVMYMTQQAILGSDGWYQWSIQFQGIGG